MQLKSKQTQCVHCYYNDTFLSATYHFGAGAMMPLMAR